MPLPRRPRFPARPAPTLRLRLNTEPLGDRILPAGILAVGTDAGVVATVRTFRDADANGTYETLAGVFDPFGPGFAGGVRVATGDFDGDGNDDLVTGMGAGGGAVRVWALNSDGSVGSLLETFLPFGAAFKGGVFVATGDLNNDGRDELAVSRNSGGNTVKVYSDTDVDGLVSDNATDVFNPFGAFAGGARIAFGNSNNTGGDELIAAQGPGGGTVKVFTDADADRAVSDDPLVESFFAFTPGYAGGVYVAGGAISGAGGGGAEIIVGRGAGGSAVKVFTDSNANGHVADNPVFDVFNAYAPAFAGGVRVAAGDTDNSGSLVEVVTAAGPGGNRVTIRDDTGDPGALLSDNAASDNFAPFGGYTGGLFAAFGKVRSATYAFAGFPQTIPDNSTLTTSIFVPAGAGKVADLDVNIDLFHSFDGDLDVTLTHVPSGTSVVLFQDVGASNEGFFIRLNDDAGTDISTATNPKADGAISGTFNPGGAALLSAFDGQDASGEWRLTIADDSGGDSGTLYNWSLAFSF